MLRYEELASRLAESQFRSRFRLRKAELACLAEKGYAAIEAQCGKFIRQRLAPAVIPNDGKQTPMRGHPCFIAQHATGCCCRTCLEKWHGIPKGRALTDEEIAGIVAILIGWLRAHDKGIGDIPHTPDLFS
ncbi:MAG: DUF4186 domain-containing protein [Lentisphaeria bacterium]|nr:DUF4186 domain-containing protein [Lentisphaeria bacterium]